jgi:hypothetical protein
LTILHCTAAPAQRDTGGLFHSGGPLAAQAMSPSPSASASPDDFTRFMLACWQAHTKQPEAVRARIQQYADTAAIDAQLPDLSALACHIDGEHLGDWTAGDDYYRRLEARFPSLDAALRHRLKRQHAVLHKAREPHLDLRAFDPADRFHITALALPAAALQVGADAGDALLSQALEQIDQIEPMDSGMEPRRLLAIVTANLGCDLLERYALDEDMKRLLLRVALTSVDLWHRVGDAHDRERADYRLALSRVRLSEPAGNGSGRYARYQFIEA